MHATLFRIVGIRCFDDTGLINLGRGCNIFVGQNNVGKSTILKMFLAMQGQVFYMPPDRRNNCPQSYFQVAFAEVPRGLAVSGNSNSQSNVEIVRAYYGDNPRSIDGYARVGAPSDGRVFGINRPDHVFVPFLALRKTQGFEQDVSLAKQQAVTGTLSNLYSRIDLLATSGHPRHEDYKKAVEEITGISITTKASNSGKEAGHYLDENTFITLDRMGDGITEMVALIVELCLERNRIFVLEEPETNLHPRGLKALLNMVRKSAEFNQFIIATHSNIVVRELASDARNKVFRVFRKDEDHRSSSYIAEIEREPVARLSVLRELGYEFTDMELFEAWLFLEESSAEQIMEAVLIPRFIPNLIGRLRTFSAGGVTNIEPRVSEFQRLVVFLHLQPVYEGRIWVRVDGDAVGRATVEHLRQKFVYLTEETCSTFRAPAFELYYPERFQEQANAALHIEDKSARQASKRELLLAVLQWTKDSPDDADREWAESAKEIIDFLRIIEASLFDH